MMLWFIPHVWDYRQETGSSGSDVGREQYRDDRCHVFIFSHPLALASRFGETDNDSENSEKQM